MCTNLRTIQLVTEDGELLVVAEVFFDVTEEDNPRVLLTVRNHLSQQFVIMESPDVEEDAEYVKLMTILGRIRDALLGKDFVLDLRPVTPSGEVGDWAHTQQTV